MFERQIINSLVKHDKDMKIQGFFNVAVVLGTIRSVGYNIFDHIAGFTVEYKGKKLTFSNCRWFYCKVLIDDELKLKAPAFLFKRFEKRKNELENKKQNTLWYEFVDTMYQE